MSTPLGNTVGGFLLADLDFRIDGFDLLPDPLGWTIAAIGLSALSARTPALRVAMILAAIIVPVAMTAGSSPEGLARVGPFAVVLVLVVLAVAVWFVVLLFQVRRDPAVGGPATRGAA